MEYCGDLSVGTDTNQVGRRQLGKLRVFME